MTSCHLSNPLRGTRRFLVNLLLLLFIVVSEVASSSGILDAYNIASFAQPEGEATSLTKFVVDSRTGSVYLAADKYLYRLALNLTVQESDVATGAECAGDNLCHDVAKILAIAAGDAGSLIICKSRDGLCEQRDLGRISQVLNSDESGEVVVVPGDPTTLTSAGVVAPGQDDKEALFVANTLSVDFPSIIHPVSRWYIEYSFWFDSGFVNFFALESVNVNDFQIQYKDAFTYGGFVYYALNQEDRNGQYFSKLARVCPNVDDTFRSYTEITLRCGSADSSRRYNLLQAVSVGAAGGALQQSLGLESASEKVLYATFSSDELSGSSSSGESAVCVFSMRDIEDSFLQAVRDCLTVDNAPTTLYYLAGSTCNIYEGDELTDDTIRNILCSGSGDFPFTYANGIQDLVSTAAVQLPSDHVPTAVVSAVHRNHTVAFVGTQGGDLLKVHLMSSASGRVYETVSLGSSPVLSSMYNDRDAAILVATEQQLYRLAVANCEQYTSCGECIGVGGAQDGDPYCGWCTLQARCTEYTECANPDQAGHWLAYNTAECIGINHLKPDSLPIGSSPQHLPTDVTFSINHLQFLTMTH
ncbi:plexin-A4-like, partial [Diadema antillarum]|uniref:plexin-A4-like n=1 Tax=Diadema antillarum TaxID=105358 RepID=UPI003A8810B4